MAGPRKGEFVSLPLGPGVLSNPTGRGAHTRIAFQNWDRWTDSNWVRWHKLLPEKRGGWEYIPLLEAIPTAPPTAPQFLLTFDGANGSPSIIDSSVNNIAVTNNGGGLTGGPVVIDTTNPKVGTGAGSFSGASGNVSPFPRNGSYLSWPVTQNGPIDLDLGDFTVEFWMYPRLQNFWGPTGELFNYWPPSGSATGFRIYCLTESSVNPTNVVFQPNLIATSISSPTTIPLFQWTHVALVRYGSVITLYINGTSVGSSTAPSTDSFAAAPTVAYINFDNFQGSQENSYDGELDEFTIYKYAKYTSNFTPGTQPTPTQIPPGLYIGTARALADWASLDGQYWVAIADNMKAYITDLATLYDITPSRKSSNLTNCISATSGSAVLTIVDTDHRANDGDYITIIGAVNVGGLVVNGEWPITFVDDNTYTITALGDATSTQTGGGNFTIRYDIYPGNASNGEGTGYGTGVYGESTYGTPRPAGTGYVSRLRTWSLDNYGEDLILSPSDGGIYWWQRQFGPSSQATQLANSPDGCQRVLIDHNRQSLIAFGCTDINGNYDSMLVRWPDINDFTDWVPSDVNDAGSQVLQGGSRIVTALNTKSQALCFTDTTLFRVISTGTTQVYDFVPAGDCTIVGPNAGADVDGVAIFMGFDNFYSYEGTLKVLNCEVWETVFDPNVSTSLLRTQSEKVVCYTYEPKTEVTWLYPSIGGSGECDRYVSYNWDDQVWYYGAWNRTCARGRSSAMGGYPYSVANGYLYRDEIGTDAVEASGTVGLGFSMRTLDITTGGRMTPQTMGGSDARFLVGGSDSHLLVRHMVPDFAYFTGAMQLTLKTKDRPQQASYRQYGPVPFSPTSEQVDIDAKGSQLVIELDNYTEGVDPYFSNVTLLLPMQGVNGATTTVDVSGYGWTTGFMVNSTLSSTNPKFAGTAYYGLPYYDGWNGAQGPYYSYGAGWFIPISVGDELDFLSGSADFTAECWFAFPSTMTAGDLAVPIVIGTSSIIGYNQVASNRQAYIAATPNQSPMTSFNLTLWSESGAPSAPTIQVTSAPEVWHHVAWVRHNGLHYLYVDGVSAGAGFVVNPLPYGPHPPNISVGFTDTYTSANGVRVQDLRITKGIARYTAAFTPPTLQFPTATSDPVAASGTSFRMGIWQGFAVPYGKR